MLLVIVADAESFSDLILRESHVGKLFDRGFVHSTSCLLARTRWLSRGLASMGLLALKHEFFLSLKGVLLDLAIGEERY